MEDPNLIANLIPTDTFQLTDTAFRHEHNKNYYLPPTRGIQERPITSSREATPAANEELVKNYRLYDSTHRLRLTLDKEKKVNNSIQGFVFGTDPKVCDVLLGPSRGDRGISGLHFRITFDVAPDKSMRLVLKDSSSNGSAVSYSGQAEPEVRRHFTWILDLEKDDGDWEIEVHVWGLRFKVELARHETCKAEYDKKVQDFLVHDREAPPALDGLRIDSNTTTAQPSQPLTPRKFPIYIRDDNLGSGSFGEVKKVINVSTGAIYARKEFYEPQWRKGGGHRGQQREDWLERIRREIRIMRENPHVSHITLVDQVKSDPSKGIYCRGRRLPRR